MLEVTKTQSKLRCTPHQARINEFMRKAEQEVPASPGIPSPEICLLRAKLIWEEAMETILALGVDVYVGMGMLTCPAEGFPVVSGELRFNPCRGVNLTEVVDGCADVSVVTIGTLSAFGVCDAPILEEVDRSNLDKFGPGSHRRDDGKWIKPPDHKPPAIDELLSAMAEEATSVVKDQV